MPENRSDECRDLMLKFLYERHKKARGMEAIPIGIRDLQSELKKRHGMSQSEVVSNLDYLVQVNWACVVTRDRSFVTKSGMQVGKESVKYKITDVGINYLESATMFKKPEVGSSVNITNIRGVTVVGDGNVVNAAFTEVSHHLDELDRRLATSPALSDEQKLDAAGDISTIRTQIAKLHPNGTIIRSAWESLSAMATVAGAGEFAQQVWGLLEAAIGS